MHARLVYNVLLVTASRTIDNKLTLLLLLMTQPIVLLRLITMSQSINQSINIYTALCCKRIRGAK